LAAPLAVFAASCGSDDGAMSGTRVIPLESETVFWRILSDAEEMPFERQTVGGQVRYVFTVRKGDHLWSRYVGRRLSTVDSYSVMIEQDLSESIRVTKNYNGDGIVTVTELNLES